MLRERSTKSSMQTLLFITKENSKEHLNKAFWNKTFGFPECSGNPNLLQWRRPWGLEVLIKNTVAPFKQHNIDSILALITLCRSDHEWRPETLQLLQGVQLTTEVQISLLSTLLPLEGQRTLSTVRTNTLKHCVIFSLPQHMHHQCSYSYCLTYLTVTKPSPHPKISAYPPVRHSRIH